MRDPNKDSLAQTSTLFLCLPALYLAGLAGIHHRLGSMRAMCVKGSSDDAS